MTLPGTAVVFGFLGVVALCGCAAMLPPPSAGDVAAAQTTWPGTTLVDLDRGRLVYVRRCSACHRLHDPQEMEAAQWPTWVRKMTPRAKLSAPEADDVLRYLVVSARQR